MAPRLVGGREQAGWGGAAMTTDAPTAAGAHIERDSMLLLRARVDLSGLPPLSRAVVERVVHATADPGFADDVTVDEEALEAAAAALAGGAPVLADGRMVAAGITAGDPRALLADPRCADLAAAEGITRSAAAIRVAAGEAPAGAVWAIGVAPTALREVLRHDLRPALVVGVPPGFVGAVEAKAALRASGLPAVTTRSERGGSAVAAAVVNALWRLAAAQRGPAASPEHAADGGTAGDPRSHHGARPGPAGEARA